MTLIAQQTPTGAAGGLAPTGRSAGTAPVSGTGGTAAAAPAVDPALRQVAQQFEAIFLRQMIGSMRSSGLSEGLFDSSATEQFRDMADARTADDMARTGSFGIADLLMKQFAGKTGRPTGEPAIGAALKSIAAVETASAADGAAATGSTTP